MMGEKDKGEGLIVPRLREGGMFASEEFVFEGAEFGKQLIHFCLKRRLLALAFCFKQMIQPKKKCLVQKKKQKRDAMTNIGSGSIGKIRGNKKEPPPQSAPTEPKPEASL